jgi:hypothetical protein
MLNWPWGMHLLAVIAKQSKSAFLSELKSQGPSNVQGALTTGKGRPLQPTTALQFATVDSHVSSPNTLNCLVMYVLFCRR